MPKPTRRIPVDRVTLTGLCEDVVQLVLQKNAAYGNAWRRRGLPGIIVRLDDKLTRLESLTNGDCLELRVDNAGESAEDTVKDMIGYLLLAHVRLLELRTD
jgi:hypothetical protein